MIDDHDDDDNDDGDGDDDDDGFVPSINQLINLYIIMIPLQSYGIAALSSGCGTVSTGYHQSKRSESSAHDHTVTARTGRHHE